MLTIHMAHNQALGVAKMLNKKFAGRVEQEGHSFNVTRFSKELNVKRGTIIRLMDERNVVEAMDADVFLALYDKYRDVVNGVKPLARPSAAA